MKEENEKMIQKEELSSSNKKKENKEKFIKKLKLINYGLITYSYGTLLSNMDYSTQWLQENCNLPNETLVSISFICFSVGHCLGALVSLPVYTYVKKKKVFGILNIHGVMAIFCLTIAICGIIMPFIKIYFLLYPLWFLMGLSLFMANNGVTLCQLYTWREKSDVVFQIVGLFLNLGITIYNGGISLVFSIFPDNYFYQMLFSYCYVFIVYFIDAVLLFLITPSDAPVEKEEKIKKNLLFTTFFSPCSPLGSNNIFQGGEEEEEEVKEETKIDFLKIFLKFFIILFSIITFLFFCSYEDSNRRNFVIYSTQPLQNVTESGEYEDIEGTYKLFQKGEVALIYTISNIILVVFQLINVYMITILRPFLLLFLSYCLMVSAGLLIWLDAVILEFSYPLMIFSLALFFVSINSIVSARFSYLTISIGLDVGVVISTAIFFFLSFSNGIQATITIIAEITHIDWLLIFLPVVIGFLGLISFIFSYIFGKIYYFKYAKKVEEKTQKEKEKNLQIKIFWKKLTTLFQPLSTSSRYGAEEALDDFAYASKNKKLSDNITSIDEI